MRTITLKNDLVMKTIFLLFDVSYEMKSRRTFLENHLDPYCSYLTKTHKSCIINNEIFIVNGFYIGLFGIFCKITDSEYKNSRMIYSSQIKTLEFIIT